MYTAIMVTLYNFQQKNSPYLDIVWLQNLAMFRAKICHP